MSLKIFNRGSGHPCIDDRVSAYHFWQRGSLHNTVTKHYDGIWRLPDHGFDRIESFVAKLQLQLRAKWPAGHRKTHSERQGRGNENCAERFELELHDCLVDRLDHSHRLTRAGPGKAPGAADRPCHVCPPRSVLRRRMVPLSRSMGPLAKIEPEFDREGKLICWEARPNRRGWVAGGAR